MRIPRAFSAEAAAAMRDAVWEVLAESGIDRDRRKSWAVERPAHLQRLKSHAAFRAVGSEPVLAAIGDLLETSEWSLPDNWGAAFVAMPGSADWAIPASGWHIDANYRSPLSPPGGVKSFALFGNVAPRAGGTLLVSGSHRLVHRWFADNPPPPEARSADLRKLLLAHPYIRDLHTPGDPEERIARFMERAEVVDGIALQVVETTGEAGDVILKHPLVMHVAAPNVGCEPRFLLSGGVTTDGWGWGA